MHPFFCSFNWFRCTSTACSFRAVLSLLITIVPLVSVYITCSLGIDEWVDMLSFRFSWGDPQTEHTTGVEV